MKNLINKLKPKPTGDVIEEIKPRKRAKPFVSRAQAAGLAVLLGVSGVGGAGLWAVKSGLVEAWGDQAHQAFVEHSAELGFRVSEVLVTGRVETSRNDLNEALRIARGDAIFDIDPQAAKVQVEALPWVLAARVERLLPDTVYVHIIERRPLAIWQNDGAFALIDEEGDVIIRHQLERFSNLIQVVGDDAPRHVGPLLELLAAQPTVQRRVEAAVRVGSRRWDLMLAGGVSVRLPEQGTAEALQRFADFQRENDILARDVKVVDLRLEDRIIVRRKSAAGLSPASYDGDRI